MAELLGANEDNFPFVARVDGEDMVVFWNKFNGMMTCCNEDPVMGYSAVQYLKDHAYPYFNSMKEADQYALDHDWPRKSR